MSPFIRPEHALIVEMLGAMNHDMLLANTCWFGGGTAIVLKLGEYRQSLDVDFLCSNIDGYRELRNALMGRGVSALFADDVHPIRELRADGYGIRTFLEFKGQTIKFEIIREGRIDVSGGLDEQLNVPTLHSEDMFAEKLLANADRCQDKSVAYRDAFDLGMLLDGYGAIPEQTLAKVTRAYGDDIERKAVWVVNALRDGHELRRASDVLQMDLVTAVGSIEALRTECRRIWPTAEIVDEPAD